jgi:hypothetical protein
VKKKRQADCGLIHAADQAAAEHTPHEETAISQTLVFRRLAFFDASNPRR